MDQGWRLGPHRYVPVAPPLPGPGCVWAVVRRDGEGPRNLLQLWEPCPPAMLLDTIREEFLQRFSRAESLDPGACHLGFDKGRAWCLQELGGTPLMRLWAQADRAGRLALKARLQEALEGSRAPRLLLPDVVGIAPGRVLAPRILGAPGQDRDALLARLDPLQAPMGAGGGERPWDEPPDFADSSRLPLRGRMRELTYLKSLMLGFGAAIPMERVVLLQGEEGLGHDRLCDWAGAAAETEGIWVANLDSFPGEGAGGLLERVLAELLGGLEPELYAQLPGVARALSGRLASFAFLRGGRRSRALAPEPKELAAALEAMAFAQARHPRLVLIRSLERAGPEVPGLLRELVAGAGLPWLLSARDPGLGPEGKACFAALARDPASATVLLERLEDDGIQQVLEDLLGPHDLPAGFQARLRSASLGNPGLLQKTLELAQAAGSILRRGGRWGCAPDGGPDLELRSDLMAGILAGRLRRLRPASRDAVNHLALADKPLGFGTLGRALRLDGDALEEALHPAAGAKLILVADGTARIKGPAERDLALARMSAREIRASAQVLLKAMEDQGGRPLLAVRLQAFALEREAALAKVLEGVEQERTGPLQAEGIVREALALGPDRFQEARLWEFQADAWGRATAGDGLGMVGPGARTPVAAALEALARAIGTLGGDAPEEEAARLHRKQGELELRLRRLEASELSFQRASALLADHPFHPEQPRLCLALGRLQLCRGERDPAMATLRSGLELLARKGAGAGRGDQAELLLALGRAQGEGAEFEAALAILEAVRRLAEHDGDRRLLAQALDALGQVRLGLGQSEAALDGMQEALRLARSIDDQALVAECQLKLGIFRSCQQLLGPAKACLDSALRRFELLGDAPRAARTRLWQARNLAAMGEPGQAEILLLRVAGGAAATPVELAERVFLDGEAAGFMDDWSGARRHYQAAANRLAHAGLVWRERLARLRCIQAEAQEGASAEPAWIRLEQLRGPVAAGGSRWLQLEWHRARALLLTAAGGDGLAAALMAWGEVMAGARELKFPPLVLEAATRSSELLLEQGEKLGARVRIQDALPSALEWWSQLPADGCRSFLGRNDLQRFQRAVQRAELDFAWPEPVRVAPEWNPTTIDLSQVPFFQDKPQ